MRDFRAAPDSKRDTAAETHRSRRYYADVQNESVWVTLEKTVALGASDRHSSSKGGNRRRWTPSRWLLPKNAAMFRHSSFSWHL